MTYDEKDVRAPRRRARVWAVVATLVLAAVVAVVVVWTGGGGDGRGSAGAVPRAGVTLSILGFGEGDEIAQTRIGIAKQAIAPARVSNPSGSLTDEQFLTAVATGSVPDLIYVDRQKLGSLAARGALIPLDALIADHGVDLSQYRDPALAEVTYGGEVYGIPEFYDNRTVIVGDDVARAAGVRPTAISTSDWEKLRELTKKLMRFEGGKLTRIGFDPKLPEFFPMWAKANGVDILSDDGRRAQLDDPRAIEALEFTTGLIELQGGWGAFKSFRDTWDFFGAQNQFVRGQLGAFPMEGWYYNVLASNSPQVKITASPFTAKDGSTVNWTTGSAWAIPRGAKNPELAIIWAKTMTAPETWVAAAETRVAKSKSSGAPFTGLYTANRAADAEIFDTLYTPLSPTFDAAVQTLLRVQDEGFSLPASGASQAFQSAWQGAVNRVLAGQQTPRAALERAQQEAQAALDALD